MRDVRVRRQGGREPPGEQHDGGELGLSWGWGVARRVAVGSLRHHPPLLSPPPNRSSW